jgi:outer membrane protein assembly factor BamB
MKHSKVIVTTYGMSESEARPLLFLETGRGASADEAFFLLCEASPVGRRVFGEALAQYRRGDKIRTPEQHIELVSEIVSSRSELPSGSSVSFAAGFIRGEEFWMVAGGKFSVSSISPDGRVNHLEQQCRAGHLGPGGKLIAGERETLRKLDEGLDAFVGPGEEENETRPAIVLELKPAVTLEKSVSPDNTARQRPASAHARHGLGARVARSTLRRRLGTLTTLRFQLPRLKTRRLRLPELSRPSLRPVKSNASGLGGRGLTSLRLSPFGWISLVAAVAAMVVVLVAVWPSSKKPSSHVQDKTRLPRTSVSRESATTQAPYTTPEVPKAPDEFALSLKWKKRFQGPVTSSPVVYEEKVYFGCRNGGLYCLDAGTGEQVWKFAAGTGIGASPAVLDHRVFIGGYNGSFWCVDANSGEKVWEFKAAAKIVSSASVASGSVLFGSYDRNLYCVSAKDGKLRWKYKAAGVVWSSPLVEKGRVFFGSVDGTFYCLAVDSGKLLWKYAATRGIFSSPAVSEGVACFGSNGRAFHFLDAPTGKELFRIETGREVRASPLMVGEIVYGASDDGVVRCINVKERRVSWTFKAQRAVRSTPFVSQGILYVTSYDGRLYALEASSGKVIASLDTGAEIYSSPAVSGSMVYFGTNDGNFYCLQIGPR